MTQSSNFYSNQREPGDCSYMTDRGGKETHSYNILKTTLNKKLSSHASKQKK